MNPSPIVMWALIIPPALTALLLPNSSLTGIPVYPIGILVWIVTLTVSIRHHRNAHRSTKDINTLITTGPYRYVRHPIYAADIFAAITILISFPRIDVLFATLWAITIWVLWSEREERALQQRFPAYEEYKERTGRFLPRWNTH